MKQRDGFVLLAALWIVVFAVVISAELGRQLRIGRLVAASLIEEVPARTAAQAGIERARAALTRRLAAAESGEDPELLRDPWAGAASLVSATSQRLGEASYTAQLIPAGALLNVNRSGEDDLRRFIQALGVEYERADSIAQALADWLDADDEARPKGAEREQYHTRPRPANAPATDVLELRHVRGMTPDLFDLAAPHLSVTGSGIVHIGIAAAPVLAALPGMTPDAVKEIIRRRNDGSLFATGDILENLPTEARRALEAELPRLAARTTLTTTEILAVSEGRVERGATRVVIEVLFVRSGGRAHTASWRMR